MNITMDRILRCAFIFLVSSLSVVSAYSVCPHRCECRQNDEISDLRGTTVIDVDCKNKRLSRLPELDLLENVTIHRLYLDENRISNLPSQAFDGLRIIGIELTDNPLNNIATDAFSGLEYFLEYLSMQRVSLSQQPYQFLGGLTMLRTLDLSGVTTSVIRSLSNETFGTLRMLETLVLSECEISSIHEDAFVGVESIMELRLDQNRLSSIPIKPLRPLMELRTLNLDQNQIDEIEPNSFLTLQNLRKLTLRENRLSDAKKIEAAAFRGLGHNLMELDLSFNRLKQLPKKAFQHLFNLAIFRIVDNELTGIQNGAFERMRHLMTLDLSGNRVRVTYGVLRGMEMSLVNLILSRTDMTSETIPAGALQRFPYLRHLDLSENRLESLNNASFSGLTVNKINMSKCSVSQIDEDTFLQLQAPLVVDLSHNNLETMEFVSDPCIFRTLNVDHNPVNCDCDFLKVVRFQTTKFVGRCSSPPSVDGENFNVASRNEEMVESCNWGNATEDARCDWMASRTAGISFSFSFNFFISALCFVLLFV